jgi:adenosylcobinamide amidohydrolase
MLLGTFYDALELHRQGKMLYAKFLKPHMVISTCRSAGGLKEGLGYIYNHQVCEPAGHHRSLAAQITSDPGGYRRQVAGDYGLPPELCATLGTAANMNNAHVARHSFRDLCVVAAATAGVEGNAGRVGDPASAYENDQGFEMLKSQPPPQAGTINILLFINMQLTPGAMVRSVVTATEAKTAALQELGVDSRYTPRPATGTGTDQIAAACLVGGDSPLTGAGKHCSLGELIGLSVQEAVMGALALQNRLTPASQCTLSAHLGRFGGDDNGLLKGMQKHLEPDEAKLLADNFAEIQGDAPTVAAAAALTHLWDKLSWGVLPASCRPEVLGAQAAQLACAVCGDFGHLGKYREDLAPLAEEDSVPAFLRLTCRAVALGFKDKWQG